MERERGFSLIESLIVVAIVSAVALVLTFAHGMQPPATHAAALGLQAALAETRALAMSNAAFGGSGATLTAVYGGSGETTLSVFAYRPIAGEQPPAPDAGFPPERYPVTMTIPGSTAPGDAFSIFVSSSGYASVAPRYVYDGRNALTADPGCNEAAGVTIAIAHAGMQEAHALDCREAQYEAIPQPSEPLAEGRE